MLMVTIGYQYNLFKCNMAERYKGYLEGISSLRGLPTHHMWTVDCCSYIIFGVFDIIIL